MTKIKNVLAPLLDWAVTQEPAVVRGAAIQVFALLALLGVKFGTMPHTVDVAITVFATLLPLLQAVWTRRGVSPAPHELELRVP